MFSIRRANQGKGSGRPLPGRGLPADAFGAAGVAGRLGHEADRVDHLLACWRLLGEGAELLVAVARTITSALSMTC